MCVYKTEKKTWETQKNAKRERTLSLRDTDSPYDMLSDCFFFFFYDALHFRKWVCFPVLVFFLFGFFFLVHSGFLDSKSHFFSVIRDLWVIYERVCASKVPQLCKFWTPLIIIYTSPQIIFSAPPHIRFFSLCFFIRWSNRMRFFLSLSR